MSRDITPLAGMDGDLLPTLYQLSQRYHSHGLYEPAAGILRFLLRHDPMQAAYHAALGKLLHGQHHYGGAVQSYRRALKLGLADIDLHLYLGQCLIFVGRFGEAAEALKRFLAIAEARPQTPALTRQLQLANHVLSQVVLSRLQPGPGTRSSPNPAAEAPETGGDPGRLSTDMAR